MKNGGHTKRIIDSCSIIIAPQVATLTPVAEAVGQFTKDYKSFATAVDTTRHELPVKNFYIDGDRREFLGNFYVKLISTILKKQTKKKHKIALMQTPLSLHINVLIYYLCW